LHLRLLPPICYRVAAIYSLPSYNIKYRYFQ